MSRKDEIRELVVEEMKRRISGQTDDVVEEGIISGSLAFMAAISGGFKGAIVGAGMGSSLGMWSVKIGMLSPYILLPTVLAVGSVGALGILYWGAKKAKVVKKRDGVSSDIVAEKLAKNIKARDDVIKRAASDGSLDSYKSELKTLTDEQIRLGIEMENSAVKDNLLGTVSGDEFDNIKVVAANAKRGNLSYLPDKRNV